MSVLYVTRSLTLYTKFVEAILTVFIGKNNNLCYLIRDRLIYIQQIGKYFKKWLCYLFIYLDYYLVSRLIH